MSAMQKDVVSEFLRNFMEFGAHIPATTAGVLNRRFRSTSSEKLKEVLIVGLHSEFAMAIETFGVMCIAMRDRQTTNFLETITSYPTRAIRSFYLSVPQNEERFDIVSFAKLPSEAELHKKSSDPQIHFAYRYSREALSKRVERVVELLGKDQLTVHIHNKTKHGTALVDEEHIFRDYYGYGKDRPTELAGPRVYVPPKFEIGSGNTRRLIVPPSVLDATDSFATKLTKNTHRLTRSTRELAAMAIILHDLDLL